jgi:hypothetical protein
MDRGRLSEPALPSAGEDGGLQVQDLGSHSPDSSVIRGTSDKEAFAAVLQ